MRDRTQVSLLVEQTHRSRERPTIARLLDECPVILEQGDHRRAQQTFLAPEVVVHETVVHARPARDLAHGRAVRSDLDEQVASSGEEAILGESSRHQP